MDTLHTQVEAAEAHTESAVAEAHIGPALVEADRLPSSGAHIGPAQVMAAGRLAGAGPLRPPERFAPHPQLAG